ncbi:MAG: hypothetical protein NT039_02510 [Candidatus Berkelbacteria bacterium]|nr:hypothetical protein [Candidatus Berkelbacteria bacterium]
MRLALTVVLFTIVFCAPALADRKTPPPAYDPSMSSTTVTDLRGATVYTSVAGFRGFYYQPQLDTLTSAFVESLGGVPTLDKNGAQIVAVSEATCGMVRGSSANLSIGSWNRRAGVHLASKEFTVTVTVTCYAVKLVPYNPYNPQAGMKPILAEKVAGPFVGTGRANAAIDSGLCVNNYTRRGGFSLNLNTGQGTYGGDNDLQGRALTAAFRNLRPFTLYPNAPF